METVNFPLGKIVVTPRALEALQRAGQSADRFLSRHASGDWGDTDDREKRLNDLALKDGDRLVSVYTTENGERIWIVTEPGRSYTLILLHMGMEEWFSVKRMMDDVTMNKPKER